MQQLEHYKGFEIQFQKNNYVEFAICKRLYISKETLIFRYKLHLGDR